MLERVYLRISPSACFHRSGCDLGSSLRTKSAPAPCPAVESDLPYHDFDCHVQSQSRRRSGLLPRVYSSSVNLDRRKIIITEKIVDRSHSAWAMQSICGHVFQSGRLEPHFPQLSVFEWECSCLALHKQAIRLENAFTSKNPDLLRYKQFVAVVRALHAHFTC